MNIIKHLLIYVFIFTPWVVSENIDCNGKAFYCVNSTHFMICVDLGGGVSSTIDNFVIQCPPTTECRTTNYFECEFSTTVIQDLLDSNRTKQDQLLENQVEEPEQIINDFSSTVPSNNSKITTNRITPATISYKFNTEVPTFATISKNIVNQDTLTSAYIEEEMFDLDVESTRPNSTHKNTQKPMLSNIEEVLKTNKQDSNDFTTIESLTKLGTEVNILTENFNTTLDYSSNQTEPLFSQVSTDIPSTIRQETVTTRFNVIDLEEYPNYQTRTNATQSSDTLSENFAFETTTISQVTTTYIENNRTELLGVVKNVPHETWKIFQNVSNASDTNVVHDNLTDTFINEVETTITIQPYFQNNSNNFERNIENNSFDNAASESNDTTNVVFNDQTNLKINNSINDELSTKTSSKNRNNDTEFENIKIKNTGSSNNEIELSNNLNKTVSFYHKTGMNATTKHESNTPLIGQNTQKVVTINNSSTYTLENENTNTLPELQLFNSETINNISTSIDIIRNENFNKNTDNEIGVQLNKNYSDAHMPTTHKIINNTKSINISIINEEEPKLMSNTSFHETPPLEVVNNTTDVNVSEANITPLSLVNFSYGANNSNNYVPVLIPETTTENEIFLTITNDSAYIKSEITNKQILISPSDAKNETFGKNLDISPKDILVPAYIHVQQEVPYFNAESSLKLQNESKSNKTTNSENEINIFETEQSHLNNSSNETLSSKLPSEMSNITESTTAPSTLIAKDALVSFNASADIPIQNNTYLDRRNYIIKNDILNARVENILVNNSDGDYNIRKITNTSGFTFEDSLNITVVNQITDKVVSNYDNQIYPIKDETEVSLNGNVDIMYHSTTDNNTYFPATKQYETEIGVNDLTRGIDILNITDVDSKTKSASEIGIENISNQVNISKSVDIIQYDSNNGTISESTKNIDNTNKHKITTYNVTTLIQQKDFLEAINLSNNIINSSLTLETTITQAPEIQVMLISPEIMTNKPTNIDSTNSRSSISININDSRIVKIQDNEEYLLVKRNDSSNDVNEEKSTVHEVYIAPVNSNKNSTISLSLGNNITTYNNVNLKEKEISVPINLNNNMSSSLITLETTTIPQTSEIQVSLISPKITTANHTNSDSSSSILNYINGSDIVKTQDIEEFSLVKRKDSSNDVNEKKNTALKVHVAPVNSIKSSTISLSLENNISKSNQMIPSTYIDQTTHQWSTDSPVYVPVTTQHETEYSGNNKLVVTEDRYTTDYYTNNNNEFKIDVETVRNHSNLNESADFLLSSTISVPTLTHSLNEPTGISSTKSDIPTSTEKYIFDIDINNPSTSIPSQNMLIYNTKLQPNLNITILEDTTNSLELKKNKPVKNIPDLNKVIIENDTNISTKPPTVSLNKNIDDKKSLPSVVLETNIKRPILETENVLLYESDKHHALDSNLNISNTLSSTSNPIPTHTILVSNGSIDFPHVDKYNFTVVSMMPNNINADTFTKNKPLQFNTSAPENSNGVKTVKLKLNTTQNIFLYKPDKNYDLNSSLNISNISNTKNKRVSTNTIQISNGPIENHHIDKYNNTVVLELPKNISAETITTYRGFRFNTSEPRTASELVNINKDESVKTNTTINKIKIISESTTESYLPNMSNKTYDVIASEDKIKFESQIKDTHHMAFGEIDVTPSTFMKISSNFVEVDKYITTPEVGNINGGEREKLNTTINSNKGFFNNTSDVFHINGIDKTNKENQITIKDIKLEDNQNNSLLVLNSSIKSTSNITLPNEILGVKTTTTQSADFANDLIVMIEVQKELNTELIATRKKGNIKKAQLENIVQQKGEPIKLTHGNDAITKDTSEKIINLSTNRQNQTYLLNQETDDNPKPTEKSSVDYSDKNHDFSFEETAQSKIINQLKNSTKELPNTLEAEFPSVSHTLKINKATEFINSYDVNSTTEKNARFNETESAIYNNLVHSINITNQVVNNAQNNTTSIRNLKHPENKTLLSTYKYRISTNSTSIASTLPEPAVRIKDGKNDVPNITVTLKNNDNVYGKDRNLNTQNGNKFNLFPEIVETTIPEQSAVSNYGIDSSLSPTDYNKKVENINRNHVATNGTIISLTNETTAIPMIPSETVGYKIGAETLLYQNILRSNLESKNISNAKLSSDYKETKYEPKEYHQNNKHIKLKLPNEVNNTRKPDTAYYQFIKEDTVNRTSTNITSKIEINVLSKHLKNSLQRTYNQTSQELLVPTLRLFDCRHKTRGRYSDSKDCNKFYVCIGKVQPIIGRCPNNTVFSDLNKQCTRNMTHCVRKKEFQCEAEGRFSDSFHINTYYICVNQGKTYIRFKFECQEGYYFDKKLVKCIQESKLDIKDKSSTSIENKSERKTQKQKLDSNKKNKSIEEFQCEEEGKFADSSNCRKYYVCTKNKKSEFRRRKKKCDSDEVFHSEKKKCVDADSYEC